MDRWRGWRTWLRGERGATGLEWTGLVVVAALVVGGIAAGVTNAQVREKTTCAIGEVFQTGATCNTASLPGGAGSKPGGSNKSRRDAERDTRDSDRDDRAGNRPEPGATPESGKPPLGGTPGGQPYEGGLGRPSQGTEPSERPAPPAWTPPDQGGGQHASEDAGLNDRATKLAAQAAANALAGMWPDASRNLSHFLGNTGEPLDQNVDSMLSSSGKLSTAVKKEERRLGLLAIERARDSGATGPITFPINNKWTGVLLNDDKNWFYALNGISWNLTGQVTAYPPTTPGGQWTYKTSTQVNIRDRYNWDGTKSTDIGPLNVNDKDLAKLHRAGLAQEFTATGTSRERTSEGSG